MHCFNLHPLGSCVSSFIMSSSFLKDYPFTIHLLLTFNFTCPSSARLENCTEDNLFLLIPLIQEYPGLLASLRSLSSPL